jgi:hypothetical protein
MHNAQHCQRESNKPERRGQKSEECPQAKESGIGNGNGIASRNASAGHKPATAYIHTGTGTHALASMERERKKAVLRCRPKQEVLAVDQAKMLT